ncbi:hypothetical protein [Thermococcus sp.]
MSLLPAMKYHITDFKELGKATEEMMEKLSEGLIFYNHKKEVEEEYGTLKIPPPKEAVLLEGYLVPEFERLKKDPQFREKFIKAYMDAHVLRATPRERIEKYMQLAMDAAEEVAKFLGPKGKGYIPRHTARRS